MTRTQLSTNSGRTTGISAFFGSPNCVYIFLCASSLQGAAKQVRVPVAPPPSGEDT